MRYTADERDEEEEEGDMEEGEDGVEEGGREESLYTCTPE
jgi:hypothetical protein